MVPDSGRSDNPGQSCRDPKIITTDLLYASGATRRQMKEPQRWTLTSYGFAGHILGSVSCNNLVNIHGLAVALQIQYKFSWD
jgi:hypothetical protein